MKKQDIGHTVNKFDIAVFALTVAVCMFAAVFCCLHKQAMHEDEFYSYYSSNRTYGLVAEGAILRDTVMDELTVRKGEGFNFALVKEVQSWDVHPPIYYFLLHFVCSLTPDTFSMWQGLIINLVCFFICLLLMRKLGGILMPEYPIATALATLAWGLSAATLTGVVFIRMYMLLTVWILAVTVLHLEDAISVSGVSVDGNRACGSASLRFWILLWIFTFLGFMTHYYFFIWLFFLAIGWNIREIIRTRSVKNTLIYAAVMLSCVIACYLFYPAFPAQMFRGQRGAQAAGNFFDLSNTWERICFFAKKVNRIGFGGALWVMLAAVVILLLSAIILKRNLTKRLRDHNESEHIAPHISAQRVSISTLIIIACAALAYFLVVSKTALMLGNSSIRYQMPVLGVVYLCVYVALCEGICILNSICNERRQQGRHGCSIRRNLPSEQTDYSQYNEDVKGSLNTNIFRRYADVIICMSIVTIILVALNIISDTHGNISFLYPETAEHRLKLADYPDARTVYVYPSGQSWIIWAEMTELLSFDKVTYISSDDYDPTDTIISQSSDGVILYIDRNIPPPYDVGSLLFGDGYCDVYAIK